MLPLDLSTSSTENNSRRMACRVINDAQTQILDISSVPVNNVQPTVTSQLHSLVNVNKRLKFTNKTMQSGLGSSEVVTAGAALRRPCIRGKSRPRARQDLKVTWSVAKKLRRRIYDSVDTENYALLSAHDVTERCMHDVTERLVHDVTQDENIRRDLSDRDLSVSDVIRMSTDDAMMSNQFATIATISSIGSVDTLDSGVVHSRLNAWQELPHHEGSIPQNAIDALLPPSSNQVSFHLNSYGYSGAGQSVEQTGNDVPLPEDPRRWSRADVHVWLHTMHVSDVDAERFRMNGKALCLMTSEMFAYRVPLGGKQLFKDFRQRLCQALLPHSEAAWWREEQ